MSSFPTAPRGRVPDRDAQVTNFLSFAWYVLLGTAILAPSNLKLCWYDDTTLDQTRQDARAASLPLLLSIVLHFIW